MPASSARTPRRLFAVLVLTASSVAGLCSPASAASGTAAASGTVPRLAWRPCGGPYQCASARVPLDHAHPFGRTIGLALIRLPARDRRHRIGSVFVNPGGPGVSGVGMLLADPEVLPDAVRARFDVIGFDPRFVGFSVPAAGCLDDEAFEEFLASRPVFPVTERQEADFAASQADYADRCAERDRLRFASTASVARDLDLLRAAVGDRGLTYVGYSYGSYLGQVYAQLFPRRVRAMVLDGVIDAAAWAGSDGQAWQRLPFPVRIGSARASSQALGEFFRTCRAAGARRCALAAGDPASRYRSIADSLLDQPVPLADGMELDYPTLVSATTAVLYSPGYWQAFAAELSALHEELAGRTAAAAAGPARSARSLRSPAAGRARLRVAAAAVRARAVRDGGPAMPALERPGGPRSGPRTERPLPRRPAPMDPALSADNTLAAFAAVTCSDTRNSSDIADWAAAARSQEEQHPYVGRGWVWSGSLCARWRLRDPNAYLGRFGTVTAAPLLVVGTRYDPATPYQAAVITSLRFPGARLLTVEGYGHTSSAVPNPCVRRAVGYYLLTRKPPPAGARCRQSPAPFS